jgi:hypothetical protein
MVNLNELNKRIRVYISGGISGKPNGNKEAFMDMEKKLHALGYDVENPRRSVWPGYLSMEKPEEFKEGWSIMMRHALHQQATCDAVVFLPDWQQSKGACIEYQVAQVFGQSCFNADLQEIVQDGKAPARLLVRP